MLGGSLLSRILPLAEDPFPPTHKAGSEFEGFFIRLESHSGRASSGVLPADGTNRDSKVKASPSRIPRLAKTPRNAEPSPLHRRRRRQRSASSASSSSSSSPPSPTPRRISRDFAQDDAKVSPKTMLTDLDPVFASPESFLPRPTGSTSKRVQSVAASLPTSAPGDLILVVCELQSAPIDQRICIYLRWIVHGEEDALYHALHRGKKEAGQRLPNNAKGKEKQSFEIVKYVPSWSLKVGRKVDGRSVQPFRIDLPDMDELGEGAGAGFFEVTPDGNVVVDLTLANAERSEKDKQVGTRLRLRSTKHCPWQPSPSSLLPMGSRGPEGWIQHLGPLLPLHWYVHSSSAPATFSLEHVAVSDASSSLELDDAVAAGRGLLHVEKNWGQAFPSGWMWCHGASPLPDPSLASSTQESVRLSLAGGSILGLTAFLVGVSVGAYDWTFAPPTALGPQASFPSKGGARLHYGPGLRMRRDFTNKMFQLDVWDLTRWASVRIEGQEQTFATQIPGPRKGGWTPGYCHHSYRCRAKITLHRRSLGGLVGLPVKAGTNPLKSLRSIKTFLVDGKEDEEGWTRLGWQRVASAQLQDRVALEFGGDFAK